MHLPFLTLFFGGLGWLGWRLAQAGVRYVDY
jgi:hypothetical protein